MSKKKELKELYIEDLGQVTGGKPPIYTTLALGEEGDGPTTLALGEEGGGGPTTLAIGEEEPPIFTTFAYGEE